MLSDEQLMLEFQAGSSQAFDELFERYRRPVYGFFRRRLNDVGRAEELTQETFLAVVRGTERYEPRARFRTYIYAIALKQVWSERRKVTRNASIASQPGVPEASSDPAIALWVREALERLNADHREVLMLREYDQLSYDEIGTVLQIEVNTVRSRLFRARMEMKTLLQREVPR